MACNNDYVSWFHSKLNRFRSDEKYCDVRIRVEERSFKCHRVVLALASEYFDTMFNGYFKESSTGDIFLHDVNAETFEQILKYVYTGSIVITNQNVCTFLHVTEFLRLEEMQQYCLNHILRNISTVENLFTIFSIALATNKNSLVEALTDHITKHLNDFRKYNEFLEMPFDNLNVIVKRYQFLLVEDFVFKDESILLDAIIRWLCYSRKERRKYFDDLVGIVNFEGISEDYIQFSIKKYALPGSTYVQTKSSLKKHLKDHITSDKCDDALIPYPEPQLQQHELSLYVHLADACRRNNISIYSMNREVPEWRKLFSRDRTFGSGMRSAVLDSPSRLYVLEYAVPYFSSGNDMIFMGHRRDSAMFNHFHSPITFRAYPSFSTFPRCYESLKAPSSFSKEFLLCGVQNRIYLYDSSKCCNRAYNPEIDEWLPIPPPKKKLVRSSMTSDDNRVYLIGGEDSNNDLTNEVLVQAYDHRMRHWMVLSKSHEASCRNFECCVHNGRIYISDGLRVEALDPVAGKWEMILEQTSQKLMTHRLVSYENCLWIVGNEHKGNLVIKMYNTNYQKWRVSKSLALKVMSEHTHKQSQLSVEPLYRSSSTSTCQQPHILDVVVFK